MSPKFPASTLPLTTAQFSSQNVERETREVRVHITAVAQFQHLFNIQSYFCLSHNSQLKMLNLFKPVHSL